MGRTTKRMPEKCLAGRCFHTPPADWVSVTIPAPRLEGPEQLGWAPRPGLTEAAPQHPSTSFTDGKTQTLRRHSLSAQGGQNGGTGGQGEGLLICLTRLWPKVSYHILAPAGPLPSPKHGAVRKKEAGRRRGAGEALEGYRTLGPMAWRAELALPR